MRFNVIRILLVFVFLLPFLGYSHQPDRSLIYLSVYENDGIEGRFEINVSELNEFLGLNLSENPNVGDVRPFEDKIRAYILKNAAFSSEFGKHKIVFTGEIETLRTDNGTFVLFHFYLENMEQIPDDIEVTYSVFLKEDTSHSNVLGMEYNWKAGLINNETIMALVFTSGDGTQTLSLSDTSVWKGFVAMIKQGIFHIWIGIDHILFILALILPSVVRRRRVGLVEGGEVNVESGTSSWKWEPVEKFKPAFMYILKIITFFTIAHTITLSLAFLNLVDLPSRLVESLIAFSVGLAAYHNIRPIFKGRDWVIAFVFGLFHGFGFASVLADLGFKGEYLSLSLVGFNIGVEIGQVVIIAILFPILFFIRQRNIYPKLMKWLSVLLIVVSAYWLIERAFDIDMPFDEVINRTLYPIARYLGFV